MERTKQNVERLIEEGYSSKMLANAFGITPTPMRVWLKKNGLQTKHSAIPKRKWTDLDLINAVTESTTVADVLRKLSLKVRPGNYDTMRKHIERLGLDTSHFIGKKHGTGNASRYTNKEVFVSEGTYSRANLKARIIKDQLLKYVCELCQISTWQNKKLVLVLDHKNGVNNDNRLENLRFLCPNCNSQQETFCRKK